MVFWSDKYIVDNFQFWERQQLNNCTGIWEKAGYLDKEICLLKVTKEILF